MISKNYLNLSNHKIIIINIKLIVIVNTKKSSNFHPLNIPNPSNNKITFLIKLLEKVPLLKLEMLIVSMIICPVLSNHIKSSKWVHNKKEKSSSNKSKYLKTSLILTLSKLSILIKPMIPLTLSCNILVTNLLPHLPSKINPSLNKLSETLPNQLQKLLFIFTRIKYLIVTLNHKMFS